MNILFFLLPKAKVSYVTEDYTIRQALEKMEFHHYTIIPILSRSGEYVGALSDGDILWQIKKNNLDLAESEKINICQIERQREIKSIGIDKDMSDLVDLIVEQNFVPVHDDLGKFIGIITRKSVINFLTKGSKAKE